MKLSVALAAYHGEAYIEAQSASILAQLGDSDELIVSDDDPGGETGAIVQRMAAADVRIRYLAGPGQGVVKNFEHALAHCTGDVIFLSDQDDVWLPGKVAAVTAAIAGGADLVLHDAKVTDADLQVIAPSYFAAHGCTRSFLRTLLRNTYVGCCMAFTRQVLTESTPFPGDIPMHDWWIALCALRRGRSVALLPEPLLLWRRHGDNVTGGRTPLTAKLRWRLTLLRALAKRQ